MAGIFRILLIFICLAFVSLEASVPSELSAADAKNKIEEILKAHASYQKLTEEIIQRSFTNYLDEIDPYKSYLAEGEVDKFVHASPELLQGALCEYQAGSFAIYQEIHQLILQGIERRNRLEASLESTPGPSEEPNEDEPKNDAWPKDEDAIKSKLLYIKNLQIKSAQKLEEVDQQNLQQRIQKLRLNREAELKGEKGSLNSTILAYMLKAISSALDSQTAYFTPAEANQFLIQVQQRLFGIGAQLRDDLSGLTVVRLVEGGPAELSQNIKVDDKIIAVDRLPIIGMDISEAVEMIRGPKGTPVRLTILRPTEINGVKNEEKLDVVIKRDEVVLKETRLETDIEPFADGVIAYLHLFSFYQDPKSASSTDIAKALREMEKQHRVKGVVLDLRNNGGGVLPQAVAVAGLFIKKGVVVSIKDNTGFVQHLRNMDARPSWDGPLVILMNRGSASAAEIVAQCLTEYGRAVIIGDDRSFGKGTFQTFTLEAAHYGKVNPQGEFKVTRGRYYTVSGKTPQLVGVPSDIVVKGPLTDLEIGEKFSKYPLGPDEIPPSFQDDLEDIPPIHRNQLLKNYQSHQQMILHSYRQWIDVLKKNSESRLAKNARQQRILSILQKKSPSREEIDFVRDNDLQREEAIQTMRDLVYLSETDVQQIAVGE